MPTTDAALLCQIAALEKQVLKHEKEADKLQRDERFDAANDEKAEADCAARDLIELLAEADERGMNCKEYPLVEGLYKKYRVGGNPAALGSGCH